MDLKTVFDEAVTSLKLRDFESALASARSLVDAKPDIPAFVILLGNIYTQLRMYPEAAKTYRQASELEPKNAEVLNNFAVLLKMRNKTDEALNVVKRAVAISPDRADICYNYANILKQRGDFEEAATWYERALSLNDHLVPAYNNLGTMLERLGREPEAEKIYRKGLKIDPNHPTLNYNLGIVQDQTGRAKDAEDSFRKALKSKPTWTDGLNNLGIVLQKQGRENESIQVLEQLLERDPGNAQAKNNLAYALAKTGKTEEAERYYRDALADNPEYTRVLKNLEQLYLETGDLGSAESSLSALVAKDPDNIDNTLRYANLLIRNGKLKEAARQLKTVLGFDSRNMEAHVLVGTMHLEAGTPDRALEAFSRVREIDPDNLDIRIHFAKAYRAMGEIEQAISELSFLLKSEPDHYAARLLLGELYLQQTLYNEALVLFLELEKADSEDQDVLTALVRTYNGLGEQEIAIGYAERLVTLQEAGGSQDDLDNLHNTLQMYEQVVNEYSQDYEEIWHRNLSALAAMAEHPLEEMVELEEESLFVEEIPELDEETVPIIELGGIDPVIAVMEEEETMILEEMEEEIEPPPENEEELPLPTLMPSSMSQNQEPADNAPGIRETPPASDAPPRTPPLPATPNEEPIEPSPIPDGPLEADYEDEEGTEGGDPTEENALDDDADEYPDEDRLDGYPSDDDSIEMETMDEDIVSDRPFPDSPPIVPPSTAPNPPAAIEYGGPDSGTGGRLGWFRGPSLLRRALEYRARKFLAKYDDLPEESEELFDYLETLTDHLPESRKSALSRDDLVLRIGTLKNRLGGGNGLLHRLSGRKMASETAHEPEPENKIRPIRETSREVARPAIGRPRPAPRKPDSIENTFEFIGDLANHLPDQRIGSALKTKIRGIIDSIRRNVNGA